VLRFNESIQTQVKHVGLDHTISYTENDFKNPKISSLEFLKFLKKEVDVSTNADDVIVDMGTGGGSGVHYIARSLPDSTFIGVDYNDQIIDWTNSVFFDRFPEFKLRNLQLIHGDWTKPEVTIRSIAPRRIKGVISVHALCTRKLFQEAAEELVGLNPDWIAFNSLFYEGPLDVLIHIRDLNSSKPDSDPDSDFNIHSLQGAEKVMTRLGYRLVACEDFNIKQDLPKPAGGERGTYTVSTQWDAHTQFSGPVYLPWKFVAFQRY